MGIDAGDVELDEAVYYAKRICEESKPAKTH